MSLPVLGTFTSANWAGAYPYNHTFVHNATGASALLLMVTNAGGYAWDPTATFAGVSMTLLARGASTNSQGTTWVFGLNNPPQNSGSIVINSPFNYGDLGVSTAINLSNTHATAPFSIATAIYNANTSTASLTTPAIDHILIGVGHSHYANGVPLTVSGGTAFNTNATNVNHVQTLASQNADATGTYQMSFTAPFNSVGVGLVAVRGKASVPREKAKPAGTLTAVKSGQYANLKALYAFDETTGTSPNLANASDSLVLTGTGVRASDAIGGYYAPMSTGSNTALSGKMVGELGIAADQPFTFFARVEPVGFSEGTDRTLFAIGSGMDGGIEINSYGDVFEAYAGGWRDFALRPSTTVQTLVLTYDGSTLRSYINGVEGQSHTLTFSFPATAKLSVGLDQRAAFENFREKIYEVGIIGGTAWSGAEVAAYDADPVAGLTTGTGSVGQTVSLAGGSETAVISTAQLRKKRSLAAVSTSVIQANAALRVARKFAASPTVNTATAGKLTKRTPMQGASVVALSPATSLLRYKNSLQGASSTTVTAVGLLNKRNSYQGAITLNVMSSGALVKRSGMSGAVNFSIALAGKLNKRSGVAGSSTFAVSSDGSFVRDRGLVGNVALQVASSALMSQRKGLQGQSSFDVVSAGTLSGSGGLSGLVVVGTLSNGSIRVKRGVQGVSASQQQAEGKLTQRRPISALSSTSTVAAGQARVKRSLTGLSSFSVVSEAATSTLVPLSGEVLLSSAALGSLRNRVRYSAVSTHSMSSVGSTRVRRTFRGASSQSMQVSGVVQLKRGLLGTATYTVDSIGLLGAKLGLVGAGIVGIDSLGNLIIKTKFPASLNITLSYKRVKVTGDDPITVTLEEVSGDYDVVLREGIALTTRTHEDLGTFDVQTNEII